MHRRHVLDTMTVLHTLDIATRYSMGSVVNHAMTKLSIAALEAGLLSAFLPSNAIHGDKAFDNDAFRSHILNYGSTCRSVPHRRHGIHPL